MAAGTGPSSSTSVPGVPVAASVMSPLPPPSPQSEPVVKKDYKKIEQALENRVSNSVKASVEAVIEDNVVDLVMKGRQEEVIVETEFPSPESTDVVESRLFSSSATQDQSARDKLKML